jgi:hypothetical protein
MLDLKSKLLAAGLVTKEQVDKVDHDRQQKNKKHHAKSPKPEHNPVPPKSISDDEFESRQRQKRLQELKALPKNEQYDVIRRWSLRNRLDKQSGPPSENAQKYFFQKADKSITWLTLEPEVHAQVSEGKAGIISFMSHHGLAHCVLPKDIVEDVAEVFPDWLRALKGHALDPIEP